MDKKGISMVIFVISIAMVLVLITAFTTSYNVIIKSARMREFASELNSLQKAVDEYKFLNDEYPKKGEYLLDLDTVSPNKREEQFGKVEGTMDFYIIDLNKLGIKELGRGVNGNTENLDIYAVSKENGKVYYLAGQKIDKYWYYTLIDELKEKLDI